MINKILTGGCRCRKVALMVNLSSEPETYSPRACDCDFCRLHNAAYISDSSGGVVIRTKTMSNLKFIQQGNELAEFIFCKNCEQLLGVRWQQFGSVNVRALPDTSTFDNEISASPKYLSAKEKVTRWSELWFPKFEIVTTNSE